MQPILKIKKLDPRALSPSYAHEGDAALDLFCFEEVTILPNQRVKVRTGVALEFPSGFVALIWDKSGVANNYGLKTLGGVIDSSYRGELLVGLHNLSQEPYTFESGHKVAQLIIQPVVSATVEEVNELSDTARGIGGFGSTGK